MHIITETSELSALCAALARVPYITIDTEFIREKTYYPILCLIQIAGPEQEAIIDPLAEGIDLAPLYELLVNPDVLKVFHACRQDIEIFHQKMGRVPTPVFDTQIAAMVCGFGESVGYEALVSGILRQSLDKSSRFTDWAQRPLSEKQLAYALADVTHLRFVYERLIEQMQEGERHHWIAEEMAAIAALSLYETRPEDAWMRIKYRPRGSRSLSVLQAVAGWREEEARRQNVPRGRVLRDDIVIAIADAGPKTAADLQNVRGLAAQLGARRMQSLGLAVEAATPVSDPRRGPEKEPLPEGADAVMDLLRMLLKRQCEAHGVAARLVANKDDLEAIYRSGGAGELPVLTGWRYDVFGKHAQALMQGQVTFAVNPGTKLLAIKDA